MALSATLHCLTGCAIGEILGLVIGTAVGLSTGGTVVLAVGLAFLFGYTLSTLPLLRAGLGVGSALAVVLAADTLSIATMEVVDNLVMALIPGAMDAGLVNPTFWIAMMIALAAAFFAAYPVNRHLLGAARATPSRTATTVRPGDRRPPLHPGAVDRDAGRRDHGVHARRSAGLGQRRGRGPTPRSRRRAPDQPGHVGEPLEGGEALGRPGPVPVEDLRPCGPHHRAEGERDDHGVVGVADHRDDVGHQVERHRQVAEQQDASAPARRGAPPGRC